MARPALRIAFPALLAILLAGACRRGGSDTLSASSTQDYQVVSEGSANGVTSTIGGPGEAAMTQTSVDTTTDFSVVPPGGTATAVSPLPPSYDPNAVPSSTYPAGQPAYPPGVLRPPTRSAPRPVPVEHPPAQQSPEEVPPPTATSEEEQPAPSPATGTREPAPPPADTQPSPRDTKDDKRAEQPAPAPAEEPVPSPQGDATQTSVPDPRG